MQLVYSSEVSLLLNAVTEHIDVFVPSCQELRNSVAEKLAGSFTHNRSRTAVSPSSLLPNVMLSNRFDPLPELRIPGVLPPLPDTAVSTYLCRFTFYVS